MEFIHFQSMHEQKLQKGLIFVFKGIYSLIKCTVNRIYLQVQGSFNK